MMGSSGASPSGGGGDLSKIAEVVLGAAQAVITFAAIPQTFRALRLVWSARSDEVLAGSNTVLLRFNNDAGANYDRERALGSANAIPTTPPASASANDSITKHAKIAMRLKPIARSTAISGTRAASAPYIVFIAANAAPMPITHASTTPRADSWPAILDCLS